MGSRRPMSRSFSGNGRLSFSGSASQDGEEAPAPSARADSRNYLLSVRPENRSTFCSIMAQLTEETQPTFETTLKSKAVSEDCNVKFSCTVSGYPEPQLTWYKDDAEMDRYCGLPKYEIFHNGKVHTLHIYNCTEDDAAIYQASARNSKGIVSCSGVLEVGTMNEYKIHQRWFQKLKQKAAVKKKELEESRKKGRGQEAFQERVDQLRTASPDRAQRKRRLPGEARSRSPSSLQGREDEEAAEFRLQDGTPGGKDQAATAQELPNGFLAGSKGTDSPKEGAEENGNEFLAYIYETVEIITTRPPDKEFLAKKKKKISNGVDVGERRDEAVWGARGEHEASEGGISLAQYLSDSLRSQALEENMKSLPPEDFMAMEADNGWASPESERAKETVESSDTSEVKEHAGTGVYKEPEPPNTQPPVSPVYFSLKDIFFGSKNENSDEARGGPEMLRSSSLTSVDEKPDELGLATPSVPSEMNPPALEEYKPPTVCAVLKLKNLHSEKHLLNEPRWLAAASMMISSATSKALCCPCPFVRQITKQHATSSFYFTKINVFILEKYIDNYIPFQTLKNTPSHHVLTKGNNQLQAKMCTPERRMKQTSITRKETSDRKELPSSTQSKYIVCTNIHVYQAGQDKNCPNTSSSPFLLQYQNPKSSIFQTAGLTFYYCRNKLFQNSIMISVVDQTGKWEGPLVKIVLCGLESYAHTSSKQLTHLYNQLISMPDQVHRLNISLKLHFSHSKAWLHNKSVNYRKFHVVIGQNTEHLVFKDEKGQIQTEMNETPGVKEEDNISHKLTVQMPPQISVTEGLENVRAGPIESFSLQSYGESITNELRKSTQSPTKELNEGHTEPVTEDDISGCTGISTIVNIDSSHPTETAGKMEKIEQNDTSALEDNAEKDNKAVPGNIVEDNGKNLVDKEQEYHSVPETHLFVTKLNVSGAPKLEEATHGISQEEFLGSQTESAPKIQTAEADNTTIPELPSLLKHIRPASQMIITSSNAERMPEIPAAAPHSENVRMDHSLTQSDQKGKISEQEQERGKENSELGTDMGNSLLPGIVINHEDNIELHKPDPRAMNLTPPRSDESASQTKQEAPAFMIPHVSIMCMDNIPTPESSVSGEDQPIAKDDESLSSLLRDVKKDLDTAKSAGVSSLERENENIKKDSLPAEASTKGNATVPHLRTTALEDEKEQRVSPSHPPHVAVMEQDREKNAEVAGEISAPPAEKLQNDRPVADIVCLSITSTPPPSPAAARRLAAKAPPGTEAPGVTAVPSIRVDSTPLADTQEGDRVGRDTPPPSGPSRESSPKLQRHDSLTLIPSATPEELASGARRKIFIPKPRADEAEGAAGLPDAQANQDAAPMSPGQARKSAYLQAPPGPQTPPRERCSPNLSRKKSTLEVPKRFEETDERTDSTKDSKPDAPTEEKQKQDPFKAPQVIRKIRAEPFSDASGHLKLWCQFFNVLSDSTIKWSRDEVEIAEVRRSSGDEGQVALAIVQVSSKDCGVYGCSIKNEYGADSTDFLLSAEVLSGFLLREDVEGGVVGEEIEMTPMLFTKGLAESGHWGDKFFGRIMTEEVHLGEGLTHKASRVKVIYGLDPIFESGSTCIIKVRNPIAYGTKQENDLIEKNHEFTKQECKIQNTAREYCKIFAAETRVIENFGPALEIIPLHLIYRPANTVPYATVEADLRGCFGKYCMRDEAGRLILRSVSEVEQKCSAFQHWIYQWTNGNLLITDLEGVGLKITNVGIATKSKGYQGLADSCAPRLLEQFITLHQCNYYCGLLSLRTLKGTDTQQQPSKIKGSRSPLTNRKAGAGTSSPQLQKKGAVSPQTSRRGLTGPQVAETSDTSDSTSPVKHKTVEIPKSVRMR
uniref:non-specific serine/threonine protein kinase n=1 Tax=Lepisosteus oculatus TaxID=7918 RepID=W5NBN5_LEPOC